MEKEKRARKKCAAIRIEPYLATYIKNKYPANPRNGGVVIPYSTDLYHCVWELMSRPTAGSREPEGANLTISLPGPRAKEGQTWKNPAYYNHLSETAARHIETCIRRLFNFEFHRILMENEEFGRKCTTQQMVHEFILRYGLQDTITDDALLKNYQRYRNRVHPKKARKFKKSPRFKKD